MFSLFLWVLPAVYAQNCLTVYKLWNDLGQTTFVNETSPDKCCTTGSLHVLCELNKDLTIVEPVKIIALSWSNSRLKGSIPEYISDLTDLIMLDVSKNPDLGGPMPKSMGNMKSLTELSFDGTQITDYEWLKESKHFAILGPAGNSAKKNAELVGALIGTIVVVIVCGLALHYWRRARIREQQKEKYFSQEALRNISIDSYKGPAKGERLFFSDDQQRFRIHYREIDDTSPIVIFESHLGMPLEIWSWAERELCDVSTLAYDRIGYGWSSLYWSEKRDLKTVANDLLRVLLAIPVIQLQEGKYMSNRPLILVGHAFGGLLAQIFTDMYQIPISGLVLLDSPPPALVNVNPLKDAYTIKLAAIFSFASVLAEFGLLRLANLLDFSIFQPSRLLKERLEVGELYVLKAFHFDGKSLRMAQSELLGMKDWVESFKGFRKLSCPMVLVVGNRVDMILSDSKSLKDWSEKWTAAQSEFVKENNGQILKDVECDSMSLCVSKHLKPAISIILKKLNQK